MNVAILLFALAAILLPVLAFGMILMVKLIREKDLLVLLAIPLCMLGILLFIILLGAGGQCLLA